MWKGQFQGQTTRVVTSTKYNYNHYMESDVSASLVISHVKGAKERMSIACQTWCLRNQCTHPYISCPFRVPRDWYSDMDCSGRSLSRLPSQLKQLTELHTYYFDNFLTMLFTVYHKNQGAKNLVCSTCGFLFVFLLQWACLSRAPFLLPGSLTLLPAKAKPKYV